ncbi:MAG: pyridoxal-phosphate dependent enzyme, partial [Acidobacteriales bacterium]|nr:pyridoxal-phosphate dependent enzyme [Terriglobales bacterium]
MPSIAFLECTRCGAHLSADGPQTVCTECPDQPAGSLYVRYDLSSLQGSDPLQVVDGSSANWRGMWRYKAVLPDVEPVTLGEGWTPIIKSKRFEGVYLKEEGTNPTGTFKARGLAMAVSMARHYGLQKLAVPSAGNAAGALAAYAAAAGIEAHIFMPQDVPIANYLECVAYG